MHKVKKYSVNIEGGPGSTEWAKEVGGLCSKYVNKLTSLTYKQVIQLRPPPLQLRKLLRVQVAIFRSGIAFRIK